MGMKGKSGNTLLSMLSREIDPVRNEIGQEEGLGAAKGSGVATGSPSSGRRPAKRASTVSLELHESKVRKNNAISSPSESLKQRISQDLSSNRSVGRVRGKETRDEALAHGELIKALDTAVQAEEAATYGPFRKR